MESAPGELSMPDFTTARTHHASCLSYGIGREIIMEQKGFFIFAFKGIDHLFILTRTQCCNRKSLCRSSSKQSTAMGSGEDTYFACNRPDRFCIPPIDTRAGF